MSAVRNLTFSVFAVLSCAVTFTMSAGVGSVVAGVVYYETKQIGTGVTTVDRGVSVDSLGGGDGLGMVVAIADPRWHVESYMGRRG